MMLGRARRGLSTSASNGLKNVVLVDGCRLPFQPSSTTYNKLSAYELARLALTGILTKTGVDPAMVDYVLMGTVIQESKNSNIAAASSKCCVAWPRSISP